MKSILLLIFLLTLNPFLTIAQPNCKDAFDPSIPTTYYDYVSTPSAHTSFNKKRQSEDKEIYKGFHYLTKELIVADQMFGPVKRVFAFAIGVKDSSNYYVFFRSRHSSIWGKLILLDVPQHISFIFSDSTHISFVFEKPAQNRSFIPWDATTAFEERFNSVSISTTDIDKLNRSQLSRIEISQPHEKSKEDEVFTFKFGKEKQKKLSKLINCLLSKS